MGCFLLGSRSVTETHVLVSHVPRHRLAQRSPRQTIGAFFRRVENVEHALARGAPALQELVQPVQLADRRIEHAQVKQITHERARLHLVVDHHSPADPQHERETNRSGKTHRRPINRPDAHDAERSLAQRIGAIGKARILVSFATESLDLADALQVVHEQRVHRAGRFALTTITPVRRERVP